jgi:hypothetical protein
MRRSILTALVPLLLAATPGFGQDCHLGVYADPQGMVTYKPVLAGDLIDFYVVARLDDSVQSFSYRLAGAELGVEMFLVGGWWGPQGLGPHLPALEGETVNLGECVAESGGEAVLVARYRALSTSGYSGGDLCAEPYSGVDPDHVVYESCDGVSHSCDTGPCLYIEEVLPTGSSSWGAVKSLYR